MTRKTARKVAPLPRPEGAPRRRVFVRGLNVDARIGAYAHEQQGAQPLRIDLDVEVVEPSHPAADRLEDVVCYNRLVEGIKAIIAEGHIRLVETLAERIADLAMSHPMVLGVSVRIEKPRAIAGADAAGVEITRGRR
jgi:dihydroneopterin aldolase